MIHTCAIRRGRRALKSKVPFEKVGFKWCSVECWIGVSLELSGFFEDSFYRGGFGVKRRKRHYIASEIASVQLLYLPLLIYAWREAESERSR